MSELRVIAGTLRSRKIIFSEGNGLRPTHNRIRETLFNWLAPVIEKSICLDAFSGSGALGFEALSRGAAQVSFCDNSPQVIKQLKSNATLFKMENVKFFRGDFLSQNFGDKKFDIVFLDPPFQKNLLLSACEFLEAHQLLNPQATIYLECKKDSVDWAQLPKNWRIEKHKQTSTIEYLLCLYKSLSSNRSLSENRINRRKFI